MSISEKRLAARRQNAKKSTGPKRRTGTTMGSPKMKKRTYRNTHAETAIRRTQKNRRDRMDPALQFCSPLVSRSAFDPP